MLAAKKILLLFLCLPLMAFTFFSNHYEWGFYSHKKINRLAVFTLPVEMIGFYKYHIQYLTEKAVNPDMRRYIVPDEAARHYIDLDIYGDSAWAKVPRYWNEAVEQYGEDSLKAFGIAPWHIYRVKSWLTRAFLDQNATQILRLSVDLGHYVADAHVPLHTTHNYNGQFSGQYGIHGFWESRLPELFSESYDLFTGQAQYIENVQLYAWDAIIGAHLALDSVFLFEKELTSQFDSDKKYAWEQRGNQVMKVYSYEFSEAYHQQLNGMVERQMRKSIQMIGDIWYTSWVDGGQPNLHKLANLPEPDSTVYVVNDVPGLRNHESGEISH